MKNKIIIVVSIILIIVSAVLVVINVNNDNTNDDKIGTYIETVEDNKSESESTDSIDSNEEGQLSHTILDDRYKEANDDGKAEINKTNIVQTLSEHNISIEPKDVVLYDEYKTYWVYAVLIDDRTIFLSVSKENNEVLIAYDDYNELVEPEVESD